MSKLFYNYFNSPIGELELTSDGSNLLGIQFFETQKVIHTKKT